MYKRIGVSLILFLLLLHSSSGLIFAQQNTSLGIGNYIEIADKDIADGDIIVSTPKGYAKSTSPYDTTIAGVISLSPAVAIDLKGSKNSYPLVSNGSTYVRVTDASGLIKKGDLVTSSLKKGMGMKVIKSGFILGAALADAKKGDDVIPVAVSMRYYTTKQNAVQRNITDIFQLSAIAATESPSAVFKYVVAAVVVILSLILSIFTFGRLATKGVEALGRNPLAGRIIELGIAFNVVITVAIIGAGLLIAFLIIKI